jgi:hypothetical protein
MAARCADNSVTDCVIVAAGDADAVSEGDGEGVGVAARAVWQSTSSSVQSNLVCFMNGCVMLSSSASLRPSYAKLS